MIDIKTGDRIIWSYRHSTGRNYTIITKAGVYHGKLRHTVRFKGRDQLALVHFDGNKRTSRVPYVQLERETES